MYSRSDTCLAGWQESGPGANRKQVPIYLDPGAECRREKRAGKPGRSPSGLREDLAADLNGIANRGCEPQQPSDIVALSMGGTRAISKTSLGRTARFGNHLPVLSRLAALEGPVSRQGTRGDGLNRGHGCAGLRTAFAFILGIADCCVRSCLFLVS